VFRCCCLMEIRWSLPVTPPFLRPWMYLPGAIVEVRYLYAFREEREHLQARLPWNGGRGGKGRMPRGPTQIQGERRFGCLTILGTTESLHLKVEGFLLAGPRSKDERSEVYIAFFLPLLVVSWVICGKFGNALFAV